MTKHHIGEWPGTATYLQRSTRLALGMTYKRSDNYTPRHANCWRCDGTGLVGSTSEYGHIFTACPDGCTPVYTVSPFNKLPVAPLPPGGASGEGSATGMVPPAGSGATPNGKAQQ